MAVVWLVLVKPLKHHGLNFIYGLKCEFWSLFALLSVNLITVHGNTNDTETEVVFLHSF